MALAFTGTSTEDFMPTYFELSEYKEKLKRCSVENYSSCPTTPISSLSEKRPKIFDHRWHWDDWDNLGRNLTEQSKRQALVPWVKVKYVKGRLFIPVDKKEQLRSLNLL